MQINSPISDACRLAIVISYIEVSHLKRRLSLSPPQLLFLRCEAASCVEERQPGEIIFARLEKNIFVCALMLLQHWGNHLCWPREKHLCLQCIGNIIDITKICNCNVEKIIFAALKKKPFSAIATIIIAHICEKIAWRMRRFCVLRNGCSLPVRSISPCYLWGQ